VWRRGRRRRRGQYRHHHEHRRQLLIERLLIERLLILVGRFVLEQRRIVELIFGRVDVFQLIERRRFIERQFILGRRSEQFEQLIFGRHVLEQRRVFEQQRIFVEQQRLIEQQFLLGRKLLEFLE
jgi:hypothetical protein